MAAAKLGKIFIPAGTDVAIEIDVDNLQNYSQEDIVYALGMELAPLDTWLKIAIEYYKRGDIKNFEEVLDAATSESATEAYERQIQDADRNVDLKRNELNNNKIKIFNARAAYEVQTAMELIPAKDRDEKRKAHEKSATKFINQAMHIKSDHPFTNVCRGLLLFAQKNIKEAAYSFNIAMRIDKTNIPAILGMACTEFHKKEYRKALDLYKRVLRINPNAPPSVRIGIGLCLFRLGRQDAARQAFERALELEPDNIHAMSGLATILMNQKTPQDMEQAIGLLQRAYQLDAKNPMVLNLLTFVLFYQGKYQDAETLAKRAYNCTSSKRSKAESFYQIGRSFHAQGQAGEAGKFYAEAVRLNPDHHLSLFGLGQTAILAGNPSKAIECMEKVYRLYPENHLALRILGSLYLQTGKLLRGQKLLQKATKYFPKEASLWAELAESHERPDPKTSFAKYEKAMLTLHEKNKPVPYQLWNNIGVLCQKLGHTDRAMKAFKEAMLAAEAEEKKATERDQEQSSSSSSNNKDNKPIKSSVTIKYNRALLAESLGRVEEAEIAYKEIVDAHPHYVDAHLRLGCLARGAAKYEEAAECFKKSLEVDSGNQDAQSLLGHLYLETKDLAQSEGYFEDILKKSPDDQYAMLALADIAHRRFMDAKDRKKKHAFFKRYNALCNKVLEKHPKNLYAANGLGVAFAHFTRPVESKETFVQVRDADNNVRPVWINLGHAYVSLKQYPNAVAAYQHAMDKFPDTTSRVELLQYIARAYFLADDMQKCKRALVKALHLTPTNPELWYNLALSLEDYAVRMFSKNHTERLYEDVKKAHAELTQATDIFGQLATQLEVEEGRQELAQKSKAHYTFCKAHVGAAKQHLEFDEMQEQARKESLGKALKQAEIIKREEEEERKRKEREEEEERKRRGEAYRQEKKRFEDELRREEEERKMAEEAAKAAEEAANAEEKQDKEEGVVKDGAGAAAATDANADADVDASRMDVENPEGGAGDGGGEEKQYNEADIFGEDDEDDAAAAASAADADAPPKEGGEEADAAAADAMASIDADVVEEEEDYMEEQPKPASGSADSGGSASKDAGDAENAASEGDGAGEETSGSKRASEQPLDTVQKKKKRRIIEDDEEDEDD
mmetsp:Transcript_5408/g.9950  ORF Transcript_5408/g.9950 Transcript_5408/m.9950 type:complete len:1130 (+) Transcript_5408:87-3476(+)